MFENLNTRSVVFNLIAINVVLFVLSYFFPSLDHYLSLQYIFNRHDFVKAALSGTLDQAAYPSVYSFITSSYAYGGISPYGFQPVQIISHMFMHAGLAHIFFNMFALYMFGNVLERVWGPKRFLTFYLITGFGAVALHMLVQAIIVHNFTGSFDPSLQMMESTPQVLYTYFSSTVGASGAIFGILVGFGMLFPNTELIIIPIPIPIKAKYLITGYVVLELFLGLRQSGGDNVAHFAHLGGALFGFILVKIWNRNRHTFY
jgi:membrane associated rhomboid family serine protease